MHTPSEPHFFAPLLGQEPVRVVDVGCNPIDGTPPYATLLQSGMAKLVGFDPQPDVLATLSSRENETYLPYAIGNGRPTPLYVCAASGMTSTLKPNTELLEHFQGYPEWSKVKKVLTLPTARLDDVSEITNIDWLKIDIQGGELCVFENGEKKLKDTLVIQTEVNFVPLYENQPLFAEIDQWMRAHGFMLHALKEQRIRLYAPMVINNQIHRGLNQLTTADAIFVKNFDAIKCLTPKEALKFSAILHYGYESYDLALRILTACRKNDYFDSDSYIKFIQKEKVKQTSKM